MMDSGRVRTFLPLANVMGFLLCALDKSEVIPPSLEAGLCGG